MPDIITEEKLKIELPIAPSTEVMSLLIKAKHFLEHAKLHAQSGNSFDAMISIHSLDNSIEYILRIIIRHLEIEEKISKTINTAELMGIYGEIDKFLKEYTICNGKMVVLPYENELRQLRALRNNVQHGLILPVNELQNLIKIGERFFEKVLKKIFGLSLQEIEYSTLIENESIKNHLIIAEQNIARKKYLEAVVACRDAFELGKLLLHSNEHHIHKMAALPQIKKESVELYWYIQSLEQEISMIGTNINISDYRLFSRYIDHIPGEYRAAKYGYPIMQREWEKQDADFCYAFVSQAILDWQLTQEKPLYEVDMSKYPIHRHDRTLNGVSITEMYLEKSCMYLMDDNKMGELLLINQDVKNALSEISVGDICKYESRIVNEKTGLLFREYSELVIIDACEFNLVLNDGPLWEFMLYYQRIPFTTISDMDEQINIDTISDYCPKNEDEEKIKRIILDYGEVDSVDKAIKLNELLLSGESDTIDASSLVSPKLIALLYVKNEK